jgi:hypothetical protein
MKRRVVVTRLNVEERKQFQRAKKHVESFCGQVSDAEVLRFLIRSWPDGGPGATICKQKSG